MAPDQQSSLWMIRKKSNHIIGPLARDQVLEMVSRGHLEADDELCPENGYWFSLYEVDEVKKHLGLQEVFVRRSKPVDGEATQAEDTQTGDLATAQGEGQTSMIQRPEAAPRLSQARAAELQATPPLSAEELASRFQRPPSAIIGVGDMPSPPNGERPGVVERSKVWMLFAAGGILLILWAVLQVFRLLHGDSAEPGAPEF